MVADSLPTSRGGVPDLHPLAWLVCIVTGLFFFYEFIQMNVLNSISVPVMRDFHIRAGGLSELSSVYFYADALFLIPAGIILDRFSTRHVTLVTMSFCVAGAVLFATTSHFYFAFFARLVMGAGNAFCFLACMRIAANWFPSERLALVMGVITTLAMLGGVVAQGPALFLATQYGWRVAMYWNAGLGLVIWVLLLFFVKDTPQASVVVPRHSSATRLPLGESLRASVTTRQNWLAGTYTCLLNLPVALFGALWGGLYLTKAHGLSAPEAATVSSMVFWGTIFGAPLVGYLSDKLGARKPLMLLGGGLSLLLILVVLFLSQLSYLGLVSLFFVLGLVSSSQVLSYPLVTETNPTSITSTALGFTCSIVMGGSAAMMEISGKLLDWHHGASSLVAANQYATTDYQFALFIIPVSFVVAIICASFCREALAEKK